MIRHSRLTALGIMLCVLVAVFAVEAKIAWFSPAGSGSAQISSAKACPAEPSKMLPQHFASLAPPAGDFVAIATLLAILIVGLTSTHAIGIVPARSPISASPGFSASLFSRPPPIL